MLSQTYEIWQKELQYETKKVHFVLIGSDMDKKEELICEHKPTTDKNIIKKSLEEHDRVIVITTYHSSELLIDVCTDLNYKFDFGVFDEAHRTVGESDKCFTRLLDSNISKKRVFMTATEKIYNYSKSKLSTNEQKEKVLSMDNEKIYGKVVYRYSMREAIEDKVLVNYYIVAPYLNSANYDEKLLNNDLIKDGENIFDIKIILTGLMIISAMEQFKFKHLLIFSNKNKRAKNIINFIELYLQKSNTNLYCKYLSGNDNMNVRKYEVNQFEKMDVGIISSARIFGEGVDIKICDSVCFADGKSSTVDIIQYVGRCLRKYLLNPNKISYVLVPFILNENTDFFSYENDSYLKLRKILRAIGTTDQMVSELFTLIDCNKKVSKYIDKDNKNEAIKTIVGSIDITQFKQDILTKIFDKNGEEINRIRNMLIYENKKRINENKILIDTRKTCLEFLKNNEINEEPINIKNWVKYCVGETIFKLMKEKYYYTKDEFKNACINCMITDVNSYKSKCGKDFKLPPHDYINNGFYYDMDPKFNLSMMLCLEEQEFDF